VKNLKTMSAFLEDGGIKPLKRNKMRCFDSSTGMKMHNHL
jgi:hypothetical protein